MQTLFPKVVAVQPFTSIFTPIDILDDSGGESILLEEETSVVVAHTSNVAALTRISDKLQSLAVCLRFTPLHSLSNSLVQLESLLDLGLVETSLSHVLPKLVKVTPNQHSWTETAKVMHAPVKSK